MDYSQFAPKESPKESTLTHGEKAVEIQQRIDALKSQIADLETEKEQEIRLAIKDGVKTYGGYNFIVSSAPTEIAESKFKTKFPEVYIKYREWAKASFKPSLSKSSVEKFLKLDGCVNTSAFIEDISESTGKESTVKLAKCGVPKN